MVRLNSHMSVPPGEFVWRVVVRDGIVTPTHTPCGGQSNCFTFGPSPLIDQIAKEYLTFLRGNKLPGADYAQIVEQIDAYTCERLGNSPQFCYDSEARVSQNSPTVMASRGRCAGCGIKL